MKLDIALKDIIIEIIMFNDKMKMIHAFVAQVWIILTNTFNGLLGGRPMTLIGYEFTDCISERKVFSWEDNLGRYWLAHGQWSWFRVEIEREEATTKKD